MECENISNGKDINEFPPVEAADIIISESEKEAVEAETKEDTKSKNAKPKKAKPTEAGATKYEAKVIQKTKNGRTGVIVDGYGVSIDTPGKTYSIGSAVELEISGKIGKADFKAEVI